MKPTIRKNGLKMVTIKVEAHLSFEDVISAFIYENAHKTAEDLISEAKIQSKRSLSNAIKEALLCAGEGRLSDYSPSEHFSDETIHEVKKAIATLVPEFFG